MNTPLKFFHSVDAPSYVGGGEVWFDVTNKTIKVYNGNNWELYTASNLTYTLNLNTYLFDAVSGSYTKEELEDALNISLADLCAHLKQGTHLYIQSSSDTTANVSYVIETNYTLTSENTLNSLTLFWHQYGTWCNFYAVLNANGNYTVTLTKN